MLVERYSEREQQHLVRGVLVQDVLVSPVARGKTKPDTQIRRNRLQQSWVVSGENLLWPESVGYLVLYNLPEKFCPIVVLSVLDLYALWNVVWNFSGQV